MTGFRVLMAEDEATFGRTVARFLDDRGHEVKVCGSGHAALKALAGGEWDVLLLDLRLPDANGVDILARVRKEHEELQTIIVTGFANVDSAIGSMRLGAFDYVTKPPNFEDLAARVLRAGEKTQLERENRRLRFQVQRGLQADIVTRSPLMKAVIRTLEKVEGMSAAALVEDAVRAEGVRTLYAPAPAVHGIATYFWIRLGYRPLLREEWPCERVGVAWLVREL